MSDLPKSYDADVAVVGAGPCGSFLANLLGQMGLTCLLIEKRLETPSSSMAIGVMPPSLRRFDSLGLTESLLRTGCRVERAGVFAGSEMLGTLGLCSLPPPFNYVLSIPQSELVRILWDKLSSWPKVNLLLGQEFQSLNQTDQGVLIQVRDSAANVNRTLSARFAVACDGSRGQTRENAGIMLQRKAYAAAFMMGDFPDSTPWASEARLFFTPTGSIESFPLPNNRRRWIIQHDSADPNAADIVRRVESITGVSMKAEEAEWVTSFQPERRICSSFFLNRVALCGDAAHVMSPIGGQGMNTGLADAWYLAKILQRLCATGEPHDRLFQLYDRCRRKAFCAAADRAASGMWLGTRKGRLADCLRSIFIRNILFGTALRRHMASYFAMLTIPDDDPLRQLPEGEEPSRA